MPEKQITPHGHVSGAYMWSYLLFVYMHNTAPYTERIKVIALERDGVVLSDEEAYEILARLVPLVKVVYQPRVKFTYARFRQRPTRGPSSNH